MINVFNIERFATHDGDGIRTVVFLKGCPLHCPWCANPESWETKPQLLYNKKKCVKCHRCENLCPNNAIYFKGGEIYHNEMRCKLSSICVENCPTGALEIVGQKMTIEEIVDTVMRDVEYYNNSNGGVTISGGEPFYQYEQMLSLLKSFKKERLHTAVETTGHCDLVKIKEAETYIDTFLFDIKQLDGAILKKITGAEKPLIMQNFEYLVNTCPDKIIIRVPIIPGFNYTDSFVTEVLALGKKCNVKEINLLPYHTLGKNKWERIMKQYYSNQKMMDKSELEKYLKIGEEMGIKVKIGG